MHFYCFSLYENFIFLAHALKVSASEYPGFTLRSLICLAIQLGHRLCLLFFTYCAIENSSLGHEESANLSPVYCIFVNSYLWVTPLYSREFIHALKRLLRNYITRHTGVKGRREGAGGERSSLIAQNCFSSTVKSLVSSWSCYDFRYSDLTHYRTKPHFDGKPTCLKSAKLSIVENKGIFPVRSTFPGQGYCVWHCTETWS